ncbi:signal transduction histidine kinase [Arthrobacter silviterrae]|nr:HAMP domain-containing sensor histidine kinase [Arthrobacter silviterrae]MDQ0279315.1 signal transduction histidine kinase [Arthrobacter silviterrae]
MTRTADTLIRRHFYDRSLRTRVVLTQAPLTLTVALMLAHAAMLYPQAYGNLAFTIGMWLHAAIFVVCLAVPWDRLPPAAFLTIPYLDFVAIGFSREGGLQYATSAGLLVLFPVFWISAAGLARRTAIAGSTVATLLMVWTPVFLAGTEATPDQLGKPLLFPFMMAGFSATVVIITANMDRQRVALQEKDFQLREALEQSRHREQLLAAVVDTVAVGLVVVDGDGHDQLINSTQETLHALAVPRGMADPPEKDLLVFAPDAVTPLSAEARPVRRAVQGESFTNYQVWIGQGDSARAVSTTARQISTNDGGNAGAVIAFHDVTEMVAALAAKDDFVANVSHEFRTPLTSIQGYLGLALDEGELLPAHVVKYLGVAERNAERLNALVADLLSSDHMTISPAVADVAGIVADSVASARPAADKNGVVLTVESPASLPALVDAGRFGQALDNLVSNAVKYSPDGGTVTVRAWAGDGGSTGSAAAAAAAGAGSAGSDLFCEVQDTGIGMSSAEQADAFTKFFRAEQALKRSIPGLGLGLQITRTIVTKHGGTITIESARGKGTTMRMVLPGCVQDSA